MFTKKSKYYDNSSISTYKECPRKYFLRHVLGWTVDSGKESPAFVFGGAWHGGMDELYKLAVDDNTNQRLEAAITGFSQEWLTRGYSLDLSIEDMEELNPRIPGVAAEMYENYIIERANLLNNGQVISIEQPFAVPIPGLDNVFYVGKLDKVVEWNGIHILEHKTTTMYSIKQNFQPLYVESWGNSCQVKGYELIGQVMFPGLQDVWVDAALVHKKIHNAFKFIPVSHGDYLLEDWLGDTTQWIVEIMQEGMPFHVIGDLKPGMYRKNEDSCFGKYGVCPFLNVCNTLANPNREQTPPLGYKKEFWEPFDVLKLEKLVEEKSHES